ncbi:hypothetical protein KKA13_04590 [Patescibacteria group bacterium]|nr:hypothetical protein [Patescibacteria group bacterium]MBU1613077.1 hypothetical protein [Patescibacteria group bacterium]
MYEVPLEAYIVVFNCLAVLIAIWGYQQVRQHILMEEARKWELGTGFYSFDCQKDGKAHLPKDHWEKIRDMDLLLLAQILRATTGRDGEYLATATHNGIGRVWKHIPLDAEIFCPGQFYVVRLRGKHAEMEWHNDVLERKTKT